MGHETNTFSTRFSLKMVSTRSKAGVNKQADAGPSGPPSITPDLAAILDGQAKMQQKLADLKKRNVDKMEALRHENSRLRRRIEADPNLKGIAIQRERLLLGRKRGVGDKVSDGVTASRLVGREQVRWDGMVDYSGEGGAEVVRGDVSCRKVLRVVWWNMCGVSGGGYVVGDLGGREGSGRGWGCGEPRLSRGEVRGMGRGNGCLLSGGEGVSSGVILAFFLCGLEGRRLCSFRGFLGFSLQIGISLDPSPQARVLLS